MADDRLTAWFHRARCAFEEAARAAGGCVDHRLEVGGTTLRLRFAGAGMVPLVTRACSHLLRNGGDGQGLEVLVWDSASTGVGLPPGRPGPQHGVVRPGDALNPRAGRARAVLQQLEEAFSIVDGGRAMFWARDGSALPAWERAAPLRHLMTLGLQAHGLHMVHAGAVGRPDGGVLLTGPGGSGKSTAALACLRSTLLYAGDDYVMVGRHDRPWAHSLYSSGKLDPGQCRRFADLRAELPRPTDGLAHDKALYFLHEQVPQRISCGFPLRAVLLPRFAGHGRRETTVEPVGSKGQALAAMAPSTVFQLPAAGADTLAALAALLEALPVFVLRTGTDLDGIPRAIESVLGGP